MNPTQICYIEPILRAELIRRALSILAHPDIDWRLRFGFVPIEKVCDECIFPLPTRGLLDLKEEFLTEFSSELIRIEQRWQKVLLLYAGAIVFSCVGAPDHVARLVAPKATAAMHRSLEGKFLWADQVRGEEVLLRLSLINVKHNRAIVAREARCGLTLSSNLRRNDGALLQKIGEGVLNRKCFEVLLSQGVINSTEEIVLNNFFSCTRAVSVVGHSSHQISPRERLLMPA